MISIFRIRGRTTQRTEAGYEYLKTLLDNPKIMKGGNWELLSVDPERFLGFTCVLTHACKHKYMPTRGVSSRHWMLLESHDAREQCVYCGEPMPQRMVAVFKLANWERIQ